MKYNVFLSTYCVDFRHYDKLKQMLTELDDIPVGVEFATSWNYPEFNALLDAQVERFRGIPTTLHAPFGESCCAQGTEEYRRMEAKFDRAFGWYQAFDASSMVMHTHKRKVSPEEAPQLKALAEEVICRMADRARREGVRLTVENVGFSSKGSLLYDQEEFIRLFDRLPEDVGALIDTGHAMMNRWDIPDVIRRLGSRIKGYHLHNNDGKADLHLPLFSDGYYSASQTERLLHTIREYSPDADLILEYSPGPHIGTDLFHDEIRRMMDLLN